MASLIYTARAINRSQNTVSREVGDAAERLAAVSLENAGYEILGNNYFARVGEIDIVAKKDYVICFVEVKYRHRNDYGTALEAVTRSKIQKILKAARRYLVENNLQDSDWRIDVVTVDQHNDVQVYENVYTEGMK